MLLDELQALPAVPLSWVFDSIIEKMNKILQINGLNHNKNYVERGINSKELNQIIRDAKQFLAEDQQDANCKPQRNGP